MTTDTRNKTYTVSVIGFNVTERIVLQSIFGLAARRTPKFVQFSDAPGEDPDVLLVDGSDPAYLAELREFNGAGAIPVIIVGDSNHGTTYPTTPRPLQWSRLLKQLDEVVANRAPAPPAALKDAVLVVDDNLAVRKFMESRLLPFGVRVDVAESGEQAIGMVGKQTYVAIFLDVIMTGVDGYQVCKLIKSRRTAGTKPPAVVMLTSKGSPFDRIRGAMAGCDAYLTKPIDEEKLLTVIAKYLEPVSIPRGWRTGAVSSQTS